MNKLVNLVRRVPKQLYAAVAILAAVIIVPAALQAWGPDRPTYTIEQPADHITFNSIINNPNIGDERNFVGIRENGSTGTWSDDMTVQPGKEYVVRMYVHNNAAANLNLVAHDVTAKFNLPTTTAKSIEVNGFLSASNATPTEIWDQATFNASQDFNLAYVPGTLKFFNNANGNGFTIPESVFTSAGAKLGYTQMDGNIPGCFQYAGYLTFIVKPQFATPTANFSITKQVRKDGDKTFVDNLTAQSGDKLNYRLTFTNSGQTTLNDVKLTDQLPAGVSYVPGSVMILNANNPAGAVVKDGDNLFTSGINIGSYTAGSNAIVVFDANVASQDKLVCGANQLTNKATATVGDQSKDASSTVTINKDCVTTNTPPELPHTGVSTGVMSLIGAGTLVGAAAAYLVSRRHIG